MHRLKCCGGLLELLIVVGFLTVLSTPQAATIQYDQCVALMSWPAAAAAIQLQECVKPLTACTTCGPALKTDQVGNVLEVDLHGIFLNGTLPPSWTALRALRNLNLSSAAVNGPLPSQWKALTALSKLDLSNNSVGGTLPATWSSLTALVDLNLSFNKMNGSFPAVWSTLTRLTQLWLSANRFTGPLPEEWSSFTNLQGIYMCGNKVIGGRLPATWSKLVNLNVMLAHTNSLTGPIPAQWAASLSNISLLQLDNNKLSGSIPTAWFSSKPRMTWFSIASNNLEGTIPAITNNPLLEVLDVQGNSLTGSIPPLTASRLPNLSALRVGYNKLRGDFPQLPPTMVYVDARHNNLTGSIKSLPTSLKYLNVESNQLVSVDNLYAPNITFVSLASNQFSQTLPRPLSPSLQMVNVSHNNFSGPIPPSWADTALAVMDISNNRLQGPIAANLTAAILVASYNSLSGTLPSLWPPNPPIQVLDLQNNSLHGKMPSTWLQQDDMKQLKFLGLANNKLSGPIPVQWVEAGGANKTKLVLGNSMWEGMVEHKLSSWMSAKHSQWRKAVCTNPSLFERLGHIKDSEAVEGLADAVQRDIEAVAVGAATSLDAVQTNNVQLIAIVGQMFKDWGSVPVNEYFLELGNRTDKLNRHELCSNGNDALPVVLALWGVVIACVLGCFLMYAYLKPFMHNRADARGFHFLPRWVLAMQAQAQLKRNQSMVRIVHIGCIIVYWGDVITDILVLVSVWGPNWPTYALFAIIVGHYIFSAAVICYRYAEHKGSSKCSSVLFFPLTIFTIPILDTFAFAHEAGLPLEWLSRMLDTSIHFTRFHESRALMETLLESIPGCILQSIIFALGNNPSRPLFVDGKIFLLSILFSGVRSVVTTVTILWQALSEPEGLWSYCVELVLGHDLFHSRSFNAGSKPHSQPGVAARHGPVEAIKPSRASARPTPAPLTAPLPRAPQANVQSTVGSSFDSANGQSPRVALGNVRVVNSHAFYPSSAHSSIGTAINVGSNATHYTHDLSQSGSRDQGTQVLVVSDAALHRPQGQQHNTSGYSSHGLEHL